MLQYNYLHRKSWNNLLWWFSITWTWCCFIIDLLDQIYVGCMLFKNDLSSFPAFQYRYTTRNLSGNFKSLCIYFVRCQKVDCLFWCTLLCQLHNDMATLKLNLFFWQLHWNRQIFNCFVLCHIVQPKQTLSLTFGNGIWYLKFIHNSGIFQSAKTSWDKLLAKFFCIKWNCF